MDDTGYYSSLCKGAGGSSKEALPLAEQIARARESDCNTGFPFEQALAKKRMSFICEVKRRRPPRD